MRKETDMFRRNSAELGRYLAGLIAIVLVVIFPVRYIAKTGAESVDSNTQAALDDMVARIQASHRLTEKDYTDLMEAVNVSGAVYMLEISAGTRFYGSEDGEEVRLDTPMMTYTNEIIDTICMNGSYEFGPGDMVTFRLVRKTESPASRIANAVFATSVSPSEFISGGVVGR